MFNSKLKKEVEELKLKIKRLEKDYETRLWKLENPFKYKIGDKYSKDEIVSNVEFKIYSDDYFDVVYRGYNYTILNTKTKKIKTINI